MVDKSDCQSDSHIERTKRFEEFIVRAFYADAFNAIIRPNLRFTISRYFALHWVVFLGLYPNGLTEPPRKYAGQAAGKSGWLIVTLRQAAFFNESNVAELSQSVLAKWLGESPRTVRTLLTEPLFSWFVKVSPGQYYTDGNGHTKQKPSEYVVQMDDMLTPIDIEWLGLVYERKIDSDIDPFSRARNFLEWALKQPHDQLVNPNLNAPVEHTDWFQTGPMRVIDLIDRMEPTLKTTITKQEWGYLDVLAKQLQRYLIVEDDQIGGLFYFRQKWAPVLGAGPTWLLLYLRDRCYFNRSTNELRNICSLHGLDMLEDRLGVSSETILTWIEKNLSQFVRIIHTEKCSDQKIMRKIWVSMVDPLTDDDLMRWRGMVMAKNPGLDIPEEIPDVLKWVDSLLEKNPVFVNAATMLDDVPEDVATAKGGEGGNVAGAPGEVLGNVASVPGGVPGNVAEKKLRNSTLPLISIDDSTQITPDAKRVGVGSNKKSKQTRAGADSTGLPDDIQNALKSVGWAGSLQLVFDTFRNNPALLMNALKYVLNDPGIKKPGAMLRTLLTNGWSPEPPPPNDWDSEENRRRYIEGEFANFIEH